MLYKYRELSREKIIETISFPNQWREIGTIPPASQLVYQFPSPPRRAGVLVPLFRNDSAWHLLLIRRTNDVEDHKGQVAFPGGRMDELDDSPLETALRETFEEIGVNRNDIEVIGRLTPFLTITNYWIVPVVGFIPWPYPFTPATEEVSRIFSIPLDWLAEPDNFELQQFSLPEPVGERSTVVYKPFDGEVLWGASARITQELIQQLSR